MSGIMVPVILAAAAVTIVAILATAGLAAWRGWLDLKRLQLAGGGQRAQLIDGGEPEPAALIELASVKERLRRLEAIANGVEL